MACVAWKSRADFRNGWIQELSDIIRGQYSGQSSLAHSLSCFLSIYLPVSLSTCFFSELAAFAVSLPSCGKDHTAPGFLCIPLAAQAERASLLQCSGLGTDTHWPSLSPVPLPGSIVMTVIGQVMCSAWSQRVELIPSQPCDLRVGKG